MTSTLIQEPSLYDGWASILETITPELAASGLTVEPDLDGDSCCLGYNLSRPGTDGFIRLFLSSRGSAGKRTPLALGWSAEVDIERNNSIDKVGWDDTLLSLEEILSFFRIHLAAALPRL